MRGRTSRISREIQLAALVPAGPAPIRQRDRKNGGGGAEAERGGEQLGRTAGVDDARWDPCRAGFVEDVAEGGEQGGAGGDAVWRGEEVGRLGVDDEQHCGCVAGERWAMAMGCWWCATVGHGHGDLEPQLSDVRRDRGPARREPTSGL